MYVMIVRFALGNLKKFSPFKRNGKKEFAIPLLYYKCAKKQEYRV